MFRLSRILPGLAALAASTPAFALTLDPGTLRIDIGLADHAILDSATIGSGGVVRGLSFTKYPFTSELIVGLGIGGAYGVMENLEIGTQLIPLAIAPEGDFGDMQFYGRYQFLEGDFNAAVQLTMQLPTATRFGLGFGLPISAMLGPDLEFISGIELEVIFGTLGLVNMDLPMTFMAEMGETFRMGLRTGIILIDLDPDGVMVPLGIVAEIDAGPATIVPGFVWPEFLNANGIEPEHFRVEIGARFEFELQGAS